MKLLTKKFFLCSLVIINSIAFAFGSEVRKFINSNLLVDNENLILNVDMKKNKNDDSVSFIALGDHGGIPAFPFRTIIQQKTSALMTSLAETHKTSFQIALGDNFYFHGVTDLYDKRFKETYEDVFDSEILKNTPWFVVLGNHDHYGNATAQIDYTAVTKQWILPSFTYSVEIYNGDEDSLISFLMIDTIILCGNTPYVPNGKNNEQPILSTLKDKLLSDVYYKQIEEKLRILSLNRKVPYLIVAGHFPVWSIAEHGPTECLVDKIRPLLHKYNVSAYLSGHDHNLQHISDEYLNQRVNYIVSGAANFASNSIDHINDIPPNSLKFHWSELNLINGGFCLFKATRQNITVTFIETSGKELYQTHILPRIF